MILLIVGMGIYASRYGGRISYTLLYFVILLPILSFLYTVYVYIRFKYYQKTGNSKIVKEEPTAYFFRIGNEDFLTYSNIKVNFFSDNSKIINAEKKEQYFLLPGQKETIEAELCCKYRGEYHVGAKSFEITDFLNLYRITFPVFSKMQVSVLPRVMKWKYSDFVFEDEDEKEQDSYRNKEEEADVLVREYQHGDTLKRIQWKTSAKRGKLYTREYRNITKQSICVVLDLSDIFLQEGEVPSKETKHLGRKLMIEDALIENALSIINDCVIKSVPCEVWYQQKKMKMRHIQNLDHFEAFYEVCATLQFGEAELLEHAVIFNKMGYIHNKHIMFITHYLRKEFCIFCKELKNADNRISIILVTDCVDEKQRELIRYMNEENMKILLIEKIRERSILDDE